MVGDKENVEVIKITGEMDIEYKIPVDQMVYIAAYAYNVDTKAYSKKATLSVLEKFDMIVPKPAIRRCCFGRSMLVARK